MIRIRLRAVAMLLLVATLLPCGQIGMAAAPAQQFLQGLRDRGYYDVAIQYLDHLAKDQAAPSELRETIKLEKALTLLASSRRESDNDARERMLDDAQQLLDAFVQERPQHPRANGARSQLGNLIAERARLRLNNWQRRPDDEMLTAARQLYTEARQVFTAHQERIRETLRQIPKVLDRSTDSGAEQAERRTQLRADLLQTELVSTAILEEMADTYPNDQGAREKLLRQAADQYEEIYERYRTRLAGLYARLYQGRVNQKLGNYRDALGYFVELLDQPDSPEAFRALKTKTLRRAVECWLHESQDKYLEVIRRCSEWLAKAEPQEEQDPDWLYLRLALARAHMRQAEEAATNRRNARAVTAARNEAEKQAKLVARFEGPLREEARQLIASLGGVVAVDKEMPIRNFADALRVARRQYDQLAAAEAGVQRIRERLEASADGGSQSDLQETFQAAKTTAKKAQTQAFEAYRKALRLADSDSPPQDVNLARYMLTYLYFQQAEYYDAALLGDFVARRFPKGNVARKCAELTLASYVQLYNASSDQDRSFEIDQIVACGQRILDKWPNYPEGEQAAATLIPFLIHRQQLDLARQALTSIPEGSPHRGAAALRVGRALWAAQLESSQESGDSPPSDFGGEARRILEPAVAGLGADQPLDRNSAIAVLCLAQARLAADEAAAALELLADPVIGPLTLVRRKAPLATSDDFREDTYRTALRASIGALTRPGAGNDQIVQTKRIMQEMSDRFRDDPAGRKKLMAVYLDLARELEGRLTDAEPAARAAISAAFDSFLLRLSDEADDPRVLNWVAETFTSLGASFDEGAGELNQTAAQYYAQAARTLTNLLEGVELQPELRTQIQLRLAMIRKKQREYDSAVEIYRQLLAKSNTALNVQIEAASALQAWAEVSPADTQPALYRRAMQGEGRTDNGKPLIWGWGRIAKVTANREPFRDSFHLARVNLTRCRVGLAKTQQGNQRIQTLKIAERDITLTQRLYGLGDRRQRAQYDAVMKEIQRIRGEAPTGLPVVRENGVSG